MPLTITVDTEIVSGPIRTSATKVIAYGKERCIWNHNYTLTPKGNGKTIDEKFTIGNQSWE